MTPAPKKKPKKRRKSRAGRPPAQGTVRMMPMRDGSIIRLTFSEDIIKHLVAMVDRVMGVRRIGQSLLKDYDVYQGVRLTFQRLPDPKMPAIFVQIEAPTFDPKGYKFWKATNGRRYQCQAHAAKLGLATDCTAKGLEHFWVEESFALCVMFAPEDMAIEGAGGDIRKALAESVRI